MNDSTAGIKLLAAVIGFWIIMRALNRDHSGRTLANYLTGTSGSASAVLASPPGSAGNPIGKPNAKGMVNPIPGSTGSRLDQGFDVTGKQFLSPYAGTVVVSEVSDSGWGGGGYVAVENASNPKQITYFAEGLTPLVQAGQKVVAGQAIGRPSLNPYNGITGNIEIGPANPGNPYQPLAQATANAAGAVTSFYNWLRSLGAPAASSTSNVGRA
ncbi:MAG TPA: hypothetical protein VFW33_12565 [Gemmataceae bacterium]|nr:hypothetical protein [Gemmataceae bacterium]